MIPMSAKLKLLQLLLLLTLLLPACDDDKYVDPGQVEYAIKNASDENFGYKVRLVSGSKGTLINESTVIAPGEEIVIVRSQEDQAPNLVIEAIEIWDFEFKAKQKDLVVEDCSKWLLRYTWTVE
jgi:hypothetical protein